MLTLTQHLGLTRHLVPIGGGGGGGGVSDMFILLLEAVIGEWKPV